MGEETIKLGFFLSFVGAFAFYNGWKDRKYKQMIENTPTSKIRSIAMGAVEAKGKIKELEGCLVSPLEKRNCVYYDFKIEEYKRKGKSSYWETILHETNSAPFLLEDDTGEVIVEPIDAEIEIPDDYSWQSSFGKEIPEKIIKTCEETKFSTKSFLGFSKKIKVTEKTLELGNEIYVFGTAMDNPNIELAEKGTENIVIGKGKNNPMFFISDKSEKALLDEKKHGTTCIIAGAIMIPVGIGLIIYGFTF